MLAMDSWHSCIFVFSQREQACIVWFEYIKLRNVKKNLIIMHSRWNVSEIRWIYRTYPSGETGGKLGR